METAVEIFAIITFAVLGPSHVFRHRAGAEFLEMLAAKGRAGGDAARTKPCRMPSSMWRIISITLTLIAVTACSKAPPSAPPPVTAATLRFHVLGMNSETIATEVREHMVLADFITFCTTSVENSTFDIGITNPEYGPFAEAVTTGLPIVVVEWEVLDPVADERADEERNSER